MPHRASWIPKTAPSGRLDPPPSGRRPPHARNPVANPSARSVCLSLQHPTCRPATRWPPSSDTDGNGFLSPAELKAIFCGVGREGEDEEGEDEEGEDEEGEEVGRGTDTCFFGKHVGPPHLR